MTKYWIVLLLITLFLGAILNGCYYDVEEELYPVVVVDSATYTTDIRPIINASCAISGCHIPGGTGVGDFTSYEGVKLKVDQGSFRTRVLDQRNMPPGFALIGSDLQKIEIWLNDGALNN